MGKRAAFWWNIRYLYEIRKGLGWIAMGRVLKRYIKHKLQERRVK